MMRAYAWARVHEYGAGGDSVQTRMPGLMRRGGGRPPRLTSLRLAFWITLMAKSRDSVPCEW